MITNYSVLLVLLGLGIAAKCHAIDHDKYEPAHVRTIREASENERGVRSRVIRRKLNTAQDGPINDSSTNQTTRNAPGNVPQEKFKTDYINNESRHNVTKSRPDINQETKIEQRPRPIPQHNKQEDREIEQEADSSNRKQIVKKDVDSEFGFHLGLAGGTEYISNFNMNPLNIAQLTIPHREKQIIQGLASLGNQNHQFISNPIPIQIPTAYPALEKLQQNSAHQIFGYKIIPNVHLQPSSTQGVKQQIIPNFNEDRLESALKYIHNEPQVKDRLENLPNGFNIPFETVQEKPRIVNQIPIQNTQTYTSTEDYTKEFQGYGDYQQEHPEVTHKRSNLSSQNTYPLILLDPDAKLGLPFYPSSKEIHQIPDQEFNYEGIPLLGPNLEGKRYNNENQTEEEKEQQRRYLLGETAGLDIPPPVGYTRETIWQAGDPDADPVPEELTLQLNETCAYITWNQTRPGNEDHRPNIWQAGDYSAKIQDEGLVLSANITCETYGQNILENVTGPYTILDYCWQCVKNDGSYAYKNYQDKLVIPQYIPDTYGPNNPQMNKQQNEQNQQNYDSSNQQPNYNQQQNYNQQLNNNQQLNYNQQLNANQQLNSNQQYGAQTNENYQNPQYENIQEVADTYGLGQNDYDIPDFQQNSSPMKIPIYPNLGYVNDPQSQHLGLQRRSAKKTRQEKSGIGNNSRQKA